MAGKTKDIVLSPLPDGNQKYAIRSNADIVCFTGNTGGGKSFALYYAPIEYLAMNENAKIVCFMRNISDFWGAGKVSDTLKKMYPLIDRSTKRQPHDPIGEIMRTPTDMGLKFYNGSEIKFQQLDNENPIVIEKITKGLQAKKLIFDECNKFLWRTITSFFPRLRSDSEGKAQIYLAQNPERECFLRKLCGKGEHGGGWINDDGTIDKSMDGVVMFFNMEEGDVDKTYWGRTREEVYEKCKDHIDSLIAKNPGMNYGDFILSMAFFTFDASDNKKMLAKNRRYRGLAANSATAKSAYEANWNYSIIDEYNDEDERANVELNKTDVRYMFAPLRDDFKDTLLKKFITIDYATTGLDNLVMKYWELWSNIGFVCKDIEYSVKNTNKEAVRLILDFKRKHMVDEKNLIVDVQGFGFLKECFTKAISFSGAAQASERAKMQFKTKKDESAHLAMEMIQSGLIHYMPRLADMRYTHQKMKRSATTILQHMEFESVIFQFEKTPNGRIAMLSKERQHTLLKGMSPDLFDNVILLCGGLYHTCYNMLRDNAGVMKKRMSTDEMLSFFSDDVPVETMVIRKPRRITNSSEILNILSNI